jgi:hypothetical protein
MWAAALNMNGKLLWEYLYDSAPFFEGNAAAASASGSYFVLAGSAKYTNDPAAGEADAALIGLDESGGYQWGVPLQGSGASDSFWAVEHLPDGKIVAAGGRGHCRMEQCDPAGRSAA